MSLGIVPVKDMRGNIGSLMREDHFCGGVRDLVKPRQIFMSARKGEDDPRFGLADEMEWTWEWEWEDTVGEYRLITYSTLKVVANREGERAVRMKIRCQCSAQFYTSGQPLP
jgi:hypothetical protein